MKRVYITPAIEVHKVELEAMMTVLSAGLGVGEGFADNHDALGRQKLDDWDMWDEEDEL